MWSPRPQRYKVVDSVADSRSATGRHMAAMSADMAKTCAESRELIAESRVLMAKADVLIKQTYGETGWLVPGARDREEPS